jgi:hypothetical protein
MRIPVRISSIPARRFAVSVLAAWVSCVACDSSSEPSAGSPTAPGPFVNRLSSVVTTTVRTQGCGPFSSHVGVDLFVTSRTNVFVDSVTLHMIDGTNLGGPALLFPRSDLDSMFGNTFIVAGRSRLFTFRPAFACTLFTSGKLRADVLVVDERGAGTATTAAAP